MGNPAIYPGCKPLNPAGKPPGTLNRLTVAAKEAIERCYEYMGADDAFGEWAKANPTEFYVHLFSKLIPKDIHVTGTIGVAQLLIEAGNAMKLIEAPAVQALEHAPAVVLDNNAQNVESVSPPPSLPVAGSQLAHAPTDPKP